MRALASSGRTTHALRAFQEYRTLLADEVGTEPSEALASLDREIARGRSVAEDGSTAGNLPVHAMSFVGRQRELRELAELVRQHRHVTLAGMGGVGKTRLATQLAAELGAEFPDGAWLVERLRSAVPARWPTRWPRPSASPFGPDLPRPRAWRTCWRRVGSRSPSTTASTRSRRRPSWPPPSRSTPPR